MASKTIHRDLKSNRRLFMDPRLHFSILSKLRQTACNILNEKKNFKMKETDDIQFILLINPLVILCVGVIKYSVTEVMARSLVPLLQCST